MTKDSLDREATWVLQNMVRALEMFEILNTKEENERLKAAKAILRARRKQRKKRA